MIVPQEYFDKIKEYFGGDEKKAWLWWQTRNPRLNNYTPMDYIKLRKGEALKRMIDEALKSGRKP